MSLLFTIHVDSDSSIGMFRVQSEIVSHITSYKSAYWWPIAWYPFRSYTRPIGSTACGESLASYEQHHPSLSSPAYLPQHQVGFAVCRMNVGTTRCRQQKTGGGIIRHPLRVAAARRDSVVAKRDVHASYQGAHDVIDQSDNGREQSEQHDFDDGEDRHRGQHRA